MEYLTEKFKYLEGILFLVLVVCRVVCTKLETYSSRSYILKIDYTWLRRKHDLFALGTVYANFRNNMNAQSRDREESAVISV